MRKCSKFRTTSNRIFLSGAVELERPCSMLDWLRPMHNLSPVAHGNRGFFHLAGRPGAACAFQRSACAAAPAAWRCWRRSAAPRRASSVMIQDHTKAGNELKSAARVVVQQPAPAVRVGTSPAFNFSAALQEDNPNSPSNTLRSPSARCCAYALARTARLCARPWLWRAA